MKTFRLNKLAAAVAASCALASGSAFALAPTVTPQITIHMSGASAEDNALRMLAEDTLCDRGAGPGSATDTVDVYLSNGDGNTFSAVSCTLKTSSLVTVPAGFPTDPSFMMVKRSAGGSGMGVAPVANATPITNMVVNGSCTAIAPAANGTRQWSCTAGIGANDTPTGNAAKIISDAGLSDVEPGMFVGPNVPDGGTPVGQTQINAMNIGSATAVVFGVPVTLTLRNALQAAEGLTVGAEDEANMPSLTKEQIASLENGNIKTWDQLRVGAVGLTAAPGVTPPSGPLSLADFSTALVKVCRRTPGSGTQAQFNANFLHSPCTPGALKALRASASNVINGPVVVENAGSGDLGNCLDAASKANEWAIGLQATEKNMSLAKDYRFIKVDGVAPTLANVMAAKYFDWSANSMQWRKTLDTGTDVNCANAQECTNKSAILATIRKNVASPAIIKTLNTNFVHPFGQAGYLALSANGFTPPADGKFDINNPVMNQTKTTDSGPDTCRVSGVNGPSQVSK